MLHICGMGREYMQRCEVCDKPVLRKNRSWHGAPVTCSLRCKRYALRHRKRVEKWAAVGDMMAEDLIAMAARGELTADQKMQVLRMSMERAELASKREAEACRAIEVSRASVAKEGQGGCAAGASGAVVEAPGKAAYEGATGGA